MSQAKTLLGVPVVGQQARSDDEDDEHKVVETDPTGRFERYATALGQGAYKEVYKAYDNEEGIEVAWNQLRLDHLQKKDALKVLSEIEILSHLQNEHIINLSHAWTITVPATSMVGSATPVIAEDDVRGLDDERSPLSAQLNNSLNLSAITGQRIYRICFITELMTSGTLKQYIRKTKGTLKVKILRSWCRQILKGLNYLHSCNPPIIHRDLKCDNIFINGNNGHAKIGDLGLATIRRKEHVSSVLGTPEFMAPELYDEKYNEKVDIYAFGMCVLELVTKEYPYNECTNPAQIYRRVTTGQKPASLEKVLDLETRAFVEVCLEHDSALRPSAEQLLQHPFLVDPTTITSVPSSTGSTTISPLSPSGSYRHHVGLSREHSANDPSILKPIEIPFYAIRRRSSSQHSASLSLASNSSDTTHRLPLELVSPSDPNYDHTNRRASWGAGIATYVKQDSFASPQTPQTSVATFTIPATDHEGSGLASYAKEMGGLTSPITKTTIDANTKTYSITSALVLPLSPERPHHTNMGRQGLVPQSNIPAHPALSPFPPMSVNVQEHCRIAVLNRISETEVFLKMTCLAPDPPTGGISIGGIAPTIQEIKFPFNLLTDTSRNVVGEMVREGVLNSRDAGLAERRIDEAVSQFFKLPYRGTDKGFPVGVEDRSTAPITGVTNATNIAEWDDRISESSGKSQGLSNNYGENIALFSRPLSAPEELLGTRNLEAVDSERNIAFPPGNRTKADTVHHVPRYGRGLSDASAFFDDAGGAFDPRPVEQSNRHLRNGSERSESSCNLEGKIGEPSMAGNLAGAPPLECDGPTVEDLDRMAALVRHRQRLEAENMARAHAEEWRMMSEIKLQSPSLRPSSAAAHPVPSSKDFKLLDSRFVKPSLSGTIIDPPLRESE